MYPQLNTALSLIKQKNEKGLSFLYDTYAHALMGVIVRIVNSEEQGQEILQQTFLQIWQNIEDFDATKCSFFTWMVRTARQLAIEKRQTDKNVDFKLTMEQSLGINTLANNYTDSITEKLEEKYKSVLYCYFFKGFNTNQTAKLLNLPKKVIQSRLKNAIGMIRGNLNIKAMKIPNGIAS